MIKVDSYFEVAGVVVVVVIDGEEDERFLRILIGCPSESIIETNSTYPGVEMGR